MSTRYRLPDKMGGHSVTVVDKNDDYTWDIVVDFDDELCPMTLPASMLTEVKLPLPPEPPVGSVVLAGGGNPTDLAAGFVPGSVQRRYQQGWMAPNGDEDEYLTWADLCAYPHPPVLLLPAPEPVALPWHGAESDENRVIVERYDAGNVSLVLAGRATAWFPLDEARRVAYALLTAADKKVQS